MQISGTNFVCRLHLVPSKRFVPSRAVCRDKKGQHETKILGILQLIHTNLWTTMFGRKADSIEKGTDSDNEYMVNDANLSLTKYISVPDDLGGFTPASFVAGVVKGFLDGADFPAKVSAHHGTLLAVALVWSSPASLSAPHPPCPADPPAVTVAGQPKPRVTILIHFHDSVLARENM